MMHLAADVVRPTPERGRCRVRVFEPEDPERDGVVVIVTEVGDNPGRGVADAIREIAAGVISDFRLAADGGPDPVFIEHHEGPRTFDLVVFEGHVVHDDFTTGARCGLLEEPRRRALDRTTVEALVGRTLR